MPYNLLSLRSFLCVSLAASGVASLQPCLVFLGLSVRPHVLGFALSSLLCLAVSPLVRNTPLSMLVVVLAGPDSVSLLGLLAPLVTTNRFRRPLRLGRLSGSGLLFRRWFLRDRLNLVLLRPPCSQREALEAPSQMAVRHPSIFRELTDRKLLSAYDTYFVHLLLFLLTEEGSNLHLMGGLSKTTIIIINNK